MSILENFVNSFKSKKSLTQADVLADVRKTYPQYSEIDDLTLAQAAAKNEPEFSFLSDYNPKKEVSPEIIPKKFRDESFYQTYPEIGKKEAISQLAEIRTKYPLYKDISDEELARAAELNDPENYKGITKLLGSTVASTVTPEKNNAPAKAALDIIKSVSPNEILKKIPGIPAIVPGKDSNVAPTISKSLSETVTKQDTLDNPTAVKELGRLKQNANAFENKIIDNLLMTQPGTSTGNLSDIAIMGAMQLNGAYEGLTGDTLELKPETLAAIRNRQLSPEIAYASGQIVGSLAMLSGVAAALRTENIASGIGKALYKNPTVARFLAPAAADATAFGASGAIKEGIRQVKNGELDLEKFGKVVLMDSAMGAGLGATNAISNGIVRTAGASAFGFGSTIAEGGSVHDAAINGAVFGLFTAASAPDVTKAQKMGVFKGARENIRMATEEAALEKGYNETAAKSMGNKAATDFEFYVNKNGGVDNIKVREYEKGQTQFREQIKNILAKPEEVITPEPVTPKLESAGKTPQRDNYQSFKEAIGKAGLSEEQYKTASESTADLVPMPKEYEMNVSVKKSEIEGNGLFAEKSFNPGDLVAPAMIDGQRTPAGRNVNHGAEPNLIPVVKDGNLYLSATEPIKSGQELTVDYGQAIAKTREIVLRSGKTESGTPVSESSKIVPILQPVYGTATELPSGDSLNSSPVKVRSVRRYKSQGGIQNFVVNNGRINPDLLESSDILQLDSFRLTNKKTGKSLDQMAGLAIEAGFLPSGSTGNDLIDLIAREQKTGKRMIPASEESNFTDSQEEMLKAFENSSSVLVGDLDLKVGDKVSFVSKSGIHETEVIDVDEDGQVKLQNDVSHTVDFFDTLRVLDIERKSPLSESVKVGQDMQDQLLIPGTPRREFPRQGIGPKGIQASDVLSGFQPDVIENDLPFSQTQENGPTLNIAARAPSTNSDAQYSVYSQTIDKFEKVDKTELQSEAQDFKLFDETLKIVKKYAARVGEKYTPRGAKGVFYPGTDNISVTSLNNISTAAHEITHYLDKKYKIFDRLQTTSKAGIREELSKVYLEYYPKAQATHPTEKKISEGIATFFQKAIESPSEMKSKFPNLYNAFFKQHGSMYHPVFSEFVRDVRIAVKKYQDLDPLQKIGARVTERIQQKKVTDTFLNLKDKFVEEVIDNVHPIAKLGKEAGAERTARDPSLWVRAFRNVNAIISNNLTGPRGFWTFRNGEFQQTSKKNIGDLLEDLRNAGITKEFGHWLVARRAYFDNLRLEKMVEELKVVPSEEKMKEATELSAVLKNDLFDKKTAAEAYQSNLKRFTPYADVFDNLTRANLEMMLEARLITPEQFKKYSEAEGYASFKRDIYEDLLGPEVDPSGIARVGKTKVSSTISRRGSDKTIINPLYSLVADHAEIMRKSMRQIVYNKIYGVTAEFPELFQRLKLSVNVDKETGRISYPQEKDHNIMMARDAEGKRIPVEVSREIKTVIDELLTPQNMHVLERLVRDANRMFVKGTTGIYPLFAPTNFIVDQITSAAQTQTKMIPIYDALSKMSSALLKSNSPEAKYFQEYMALGGDHQTMIKWMDMNPEELFKAVDKEKKGIERAIDSVKKGLDILSLPNQATEIMTRGTEYIRSRMQGNPQVVALEDAGRVSVPFHHIGRLGGGTAGQTLVKSIPFMNPGLQALAQYYRAIEGKDTRNRALFVTLAVTAAMVGSAAWLMEKATEDQKNAYKDLDPRELAMYLWYPSPDGKRLLKVRIPEQMGSLATMINMAMANEILNAKYGAGDIINGGTAFLPDQLDVSDPGRMFFSALPQFVKPLIGVLTNTREFPKIRPLVNQALQYQEPRFQFHENTSELGKWIGDKLNISPIKVDYLIEGYMGRTTRFITGKPISNPFIREWYFTAGRNLQDYYEIREATRARIKSVNDGMRTISNDEWNQLKGKAETIKETERLLGTLRDIKKSGDQAKYEEDIRSIRRAILDNVDRLRD